jgi:hypothetical protein
MDKLIDYIIITTPLLTKEQLEEVLAVTEGVEWRNPDYNGIERTCATFPISSAANKAYPVPEGKLEQTLKVDMMLLDVTLNALRIYKEKFQLHTSTDSGFDILRYEVGQLISYHVDDNEPRVLSMSIALNDDYTGGEFRFFKNDNIKVKLNAGCAIMFPSNFMYPHEILPVTSGTRYSMITWFK